MGAKKGKFRIPKLHLRLPGSRTLLTCMMLCMQGEWALCTAALFQVCVYMSLLPCLQRAALLLVLHTLVFPSSDISDGLLVFEPLC